MLVHTVIYIFCFIFFKSLGQSLRNYAHVVTIVAKKREGFDRKRSNVLCQRIAGREVSFSQPSGSNRRKNAAAIFRCSPYVHRGDTRNSTRRDDALNRSVSPLSKNAGAMPILADGKSA